MFRPPVNAGPPRLERSLRLLAACGLAFGSAACQPNPQLRLDDPELAAFVRLVMPREIEIQRYLTKPVSFAGDGNADGLEVILAARDLFGDPVKVVGRFQFELCHVRLASADRLGERVALWKVEINAEQTFAEYWERYSRWYVFPLRLDQGPLPPGRYLLTARLLFPTGRRLSDQYEFEHRAGPVPAVSPS